LKDYLNQIYFYRKKSDNEEDNDVEGTIGDPANIRTVYNLDDLLNLAGDCARELGKNSKVSYKILDRLCKELHGWPMHRAR
jgi:hypothetical protein